jgi:putative peptide zinc metalloprotease protein
VVAIACIVLPVLGIFYILLRLIRQSATGLWKKTRGSALKRGTAIMAIAAIVTGLAWAWWPGTDTYRPVQPYERGTLADATTAIFPAAATGRLREGQSGRTVALWPEAAKKPTRDAPQLSMVLVPRQTGTSGGAEAAEAPSWVFPFDRPAAPEGDGNQSLAANTTDGSVAYDVAFALVWADDGEDVQTRNEAYAFASCADCTAVAVGFQVVLIVGQTDVIVPENLSAAANYNCLRCLTYALADQLVLTLDGPLSADGTARLNELWQQIAEFGKSLQNVPLSEIQGRLNGFKEQIIDVIKSDPTARPGSPASPATPPAATPSTSSSPTPGGSQAPTPGATGTPRPSGGSTPTAPAPAPTPAPPGGTPTSGSQPTPSTLRTVPAPTTTPAPTSGASQASPGTTTTEAPKP